jgi:hypothetical protein
MEAARKRARESFRGRDALVGDRLRERSALLDPRPDCCEALRADEAGRLDQVGYEFCDLVDGKRRSEPGVAVFRGVTGSGSTGESEVAGSFQVHGIPQSRYRQNPEEA